MAEVKAIAPSLATMHQHKEAFRALFDQNDMAQATLEFLDWMTEAKTMYKNSVGTMTRWFGEIVQYFEHRTTSAEI